MSWDVMVFSGEGFSGKMDADWQPAPLGAAASVRAASSRALADTIDWSDPTWGLWADDACSIELNVGEEDPVEAIMLHVRGGGDALSPIRALCEALDAVALDGSSGDVIDFDEPPDSWERFQAFRDRILRDSQR